jgi:hypothetical protein
MRKEISEKIRKNSQTGLACFGRPRDMVGRGLLLALHRAGQICLPAPRVVSQYSANWRFLSELSSESAIPRQETALGAHPKYEAHPKTGDSSVQIPQKATRTAGMVYSMWRKNSRDFFDSP